MHLYYSKVEEKLKRINGFVKGKEKKSENEGFNLIKV
jgi:hypothetical protein